MIDGERRSFTVAELRIAGADDAPVIAGHAAVFDLLSEDLGGFRERVAAGAFSKSIGGDVRALLNHDPNIVLGRTRAKTLRLSEDGKGLAIEIDPPATEAGRSVVESIRRGDISQMSFGFRVVEQEWAETADLGIVRTLNEVNLFDVSPVTFPAYPQTDVAVRSLAAWRGADEAARAAAAAAETETNAALATMRARTLQAEAS